MGSVSGGCVEGAVATEAVAALADGQPRLLTYGVSDETAFAVGLACGGTIRVLVEPVGAAAPALSESLLAELVEARAAGRAVAVATDLSQWTRTLLQPGQDAAADLRFRADRSGREEDGRFIAVHNAPLRLIVVGAVHIAQPLLSMSRVCGYAPVLIDPRSAFGSAARFPGETILDDWPDEALASLAPDARTAIVTLTHDPKLDDPAILAALAAVKTVAARYAPGTTVQDQAAYKAEQTKGINQNGDEVDMGTPFDFLTEDRANNPAARNYLQLDKTVLQNRKILEDSMMEAAKEAGLALLPESVVMFALSSRFGALADRLDAGPVHALVGNDLARPVEQPGVEVEERHMAPGAAAQPEGREAEPRRAGDGAIGRSPATVPSTTAGAGATRAAMARRSAGT